MTFSPALAAVERTSDQLVAVCSHLCRTRQFASLATLASKIDAPIGRYYEALISSGHKDIGVFTTTGIADHHKARVIAARAKAYRHAGQFMEALRVNQDALRLAIRTSDYATVFQSFKEAAIIHSLHGEHERARQLFEASLPAVKLCADSLPICSYDYMNSLAVELAALGRIKEAQYYSSRVVNSPFASIYPEVSETAQEIADLGRGVTRTYITVPGRKADILEFPAPLTGTLATDERTKVDYKGFPPDREDAPDGNDRRMAACSAGRDGARKYSLYVPVHHGP